MPLSRPRLFLCFIRILTHWTPEDHASIAEWCESAGLLGTAYRLNLMLAERTRPDARLASRLTRATQSGPTAAEDLLPFLLTVADQLGFVRPPARGRPAAPRSVARLPERVLAGRCPGADRRGLAHGLG